MVSQPCVKYTIPTPFMGVGSEVYGAILNGRLGVGVELKPSYYRQALKNLAAITAEAQQETLGELVVG